MHSDLHVGLHVLLESLVDDTELSNEISNLVKHNGRAVPPIDNITATDSEGYAHSSHFVKANSYHQSTVNFVNTLILKA